MHPHQTAAVALERASHDVANTTVASMAAVVSVDFSAVMGVVG